ncbi:unnamed protein product [marine sediment metagenome]|uniref:Uncharacterized protein n=1 Tax=marine sediment metagenome TaxID=412755 RepID=X1DDA4_9ZZZZ
MESLNSIERVKAALNFQGPDKVPMWKFSQGSDVYTLASLPSKSWQPGHYENEKGLFPHVPDFLINYKLWEWDKPEWAKDPKYMDWINFTTAVKMKIAP